MEDEFRGGTSLNSGVRSDLKVLEMEATLEGKVEKHTWLLN